MLRQKKYSDKRNTNTKEIPRQKKYSYKRNTQTKEILRQKKYSPIPRGWNVWRWQYRVSGNTDISSLSMLTMASLTRSAADPWTVEFTACRSAWDQSQQSLQYRYSKHSNKCNHVWENYKHNVCALYLFPMELKICSFCIISGQLFISCRLKIEIMVNV